MIQGISEKDIVTRSEETKSPESLRWAQLKEQPVEGYGDLQITVGS